MCKTQGGNFMDILIINNLSDLIILHRKSDQIYSKEGLNSYLPYFKEMENILKQKKSIRSI